MAAAAGLHVGWLLREKNAVVAWFGQFLELLASSRSVFLHLPFQVADISLDLLAPLILIGLGHLFSLSFLIQAVSGLLFALLGRDCLFCLLLVYLLLELCLGELFEGNLLSLCTPAMLFSVDDEK